MQTKESLMLAVNHGDKLGIFHDLIYPLMERPKRPWRDDAPFLAIAAVLSQKGGNINRCREGQQELLDDLGIKRPVVSERTIKRAIKDYGRSKPREALP